MKLHKKQKSLSSDYYLELKMDIYTMATYARQLGLEIPDDLKDEISILVNEDEYKVSESKHEINEIEHEVITEISPVKKEPSKNEP